MNTLLQWLNRLKKNGGSVLRRPFLVYVLCVLLVLALALGILISIGKTNAEGISLAYQVPATNLSAPQLRGIGMDLKQPEAANLLENAGFTPLLYKDALPITRIEEHSVFSSYSLTQAANYPEGFFNGAELRFVRSSNGLQEDLGSGQVLAHTALQIGLGRALNLSDATAVTVTDLTWRERSDGSIRDNVAVGLDGFAMSSLLGNNPTRINVDAEEDFSAVFADEQGYVLLSKTGELFLSDANAKNWSKAAITAPETSWYATDVLRLNGKILITGTLGRLLIVEGEQSHWLQLPSSARLNAIIQHGEEIIIAADSDELWSSPLAEATERYSPITTGHFEGTAPDWQQISSKDGLLVITGSGNKMLGGTDSATLQVLASPYPESTRSTASAVILSDERIILHMPGGMSYYSEDAGQTYHELPSEKGISRFFALGKDRLLAVDRAARPTLYPLETRFDLGKEVNTLKLAPGDSVQLEQLDFAKDESGQTLVSYWQSPQPLQINAYSVQSEIPSSAAATSETRVYELLLEQSEASQALNSSVFQEGLVYSVRVRARLGQGADAASELKVVLSGPFPEQTLIFTDWRSDVSEQELKFVMPRLTGDLAQESIFRIEASGKILLDQLYLGLDKDQDSSLSSAQIERIVSAQPAVLRFSNLSIGGPALRAEQWAVEGEVFVPASRSTTGSAVQAPLVRLNLAEAMRLCRTAQAQPWLCIEAYTSAAEVQDMIAYLAGSIDEPFGQLRLDQGFAAPWTSGFERIYLEFKDDGDVYRTAEEKAAFANTMKQAVEQSPQYNQIKNKLVFVDGMNYHGERMLSNADFHAADLPMAEAVGAAPFAAIRELYEAYRLELPRKMESGGEGSQELLRAVQDHPALAGLNAVEQLYLVLYDYGEGTALVNLASDLGENASVLFELSRLPDEARRVGMQEDENLSVLSFSDGEKPRIFVWSTSDNKAVLSLNTGGLDASQLRIAYYDRSLRLQSSGDYPGDDKAITLLPGMFVLVY